MNGARSAQSPIRQRQGAVNHQQGHLFESILDASCTYYSQQGIAEIEKTPEPLHVIKRQGNTFLAIFEKKAQPDYKGTIAGGQSVVFEAKSTSRGRMEQSYITDEQTRKMDSHAALGAGCYVLLTFDFRQYFRIPWDVWKSMKMHYGHLYVTPEEIQCFRLRMEPNGVLLFLEGV